MAGIRIDKGGGAADISATSNGVFGGDFGTFVSLDPKQLRM